MTRQNAILRIVIFSFVIVLLLGVLLIGIGCGISVIHFSSDSNAQTISQSSVSPADYQNLEIEWASGDIYLVAADTDQITFSESGNITNQSQKMVVKENGSTLSIRYQASSVQFGFNSSPRKDLTITVPRTWNCKLLGIEAASVNIQASDLQIDELNLELASADCSFDNCSIQNVDVDAASGNLVFRGTINSLSCDAASADVTAVLTNVPKEIDFETASGEMDLTLPANAGFSVEMDTLSGGFTCEFDAASHGRHYTYGDGACRISMDGMSGNLIIRKGA